ncbi:SpoIIE family protein phosphatase [Planobispora siamensis]|uniref:SpoIIE family protein phosphatase n=1 Tax=Planobispora siamensis TaxID=936338 RepID=UPI00194F18C0|nr:SpoIIE family protein phosphatase [Planobispora siamensis]
MEQVIRSRNDVWVRAEDASVIGSLRHSATALAQARGFSEKEIGRMAVAVSEAASNLVKHAVEGVMLIRPHPELDSAVEVIALDRGPGMQNVSRALRDGYSTAGTLGIGLGGIARMADGCDIHSLPGRGTVIALHFVARHAPSPPSLVSGLTRPIGEEIVCGDAFAVAGTGATTTVMLCDGLGHGEAAAHASNEAVRVFTENPGLAPAAALERIHRRLSGTRGGAVAVATVDRQSRTVTFAGLGNISGWIVHPDGRQGMVSVPGIAGSRAPSAFRQYEYALPPHSMAVLHSDGLSERWNIVSYPGLVTRPPSVLAATLLRDAGTRRDDACVVTVRAET